MLPPNRGDYERVAVVGAGVAGLTAAHDLARLGYKVTVFEAYSTPGGMLTAGVPGLSSAARIGDGRDRRHSLARRGAEMQSAPGPRLHHPESARRRDTKPSSSASACPRAASSTCLARISTAFTTAWIFCAPSTKATPLPVGRAHHRHRRRQRGLRRGAFGRASAGSIRACRDSASDMHTRRVQQASTWPAQLSA